jgi:hypothetical protein
MKPRLVRAPGVALVSYQHCSEKHLRRYLAEFDFRYNNRVRLGVNDAERVAKIAKNIDGKRLLYRPS